MFVELSPGRKGFKSAREKLVKRFFSLKICETNFSLDSLTNSEKGLLRPSTTVCVIVEVESELLCNMRDSDLLLGFDNPV